MPRTVLTHFPGLPGAGTDLRAKFFLLPVPPSVCPTDPYPKICKLGCVGAMLSCPSQTDTKSRAAPHRSFPEDEANTNNCLGDKLKRWPCDAMRRLGRQRAWVAVWNHVPVSTTIRDNLHRTWRANKPDYRGAWPKVTGLFGPCSLLHVRSDRGLVSE